MLADENPVTKRNQKQTRELRVTRGLTGITLGATGAEVCNCDGEVGSSNPRGRGGEMEVGSGSV